MVKWLESNQPAPGLQFNGEDVSAGIHQPPKTLGKSGNSQTSQASRRSPKLEFAIRWLETHPDDLLVSGRTLETKVLMDGAGISYKWWNQAKKHIGKEGGSK